MIFSKTIAGVEAPRNGAGSPPSGRTKKSHPYYVGEVVFNGLNSTNCSDPQSVYESLLTSSCGLLIRFGAKLLVDIVVSKALREV